MMTPRREFLLTLASALAAAAAKLPANQNVKWALSTSLWGHFKPVPFTDILDVMRDTGFPGVRLTSFPGILEKYNMTAAQMEREHEGNVISPEAELRNRQQTRDEDADLDGAE